MSKKLGRPSESKRRNCGHCHQCGARLRMVLDGEEVCPVCQTYRRYVSHGWSSAFATAEDLTPCPPAEPRTGS